MAAAALTATLGAGFTAQLGAMRISEEVDALEVMAVPSVPFLITTRVIAGVIAIIPMYTIGLLASFAAARLNVTARQRPVPAAPTTTTSTCSCRSATSCTPISRSSSSPW